MQYEFVFSFFFYGMTTIKYTLDYLISNFVCNVTITEQISWLTCEGEKFNGHASGGRRVVVDC